MLHCNNKHEQCEQFNGMIMCGKLASKLLPRLTVFAAGLTQSLLTSIPHSELLHFYLDVTQINAYEMGILCTNLLQALNFAFHFVLYCAVNATFRRTLIIIFYSTIRKGHKQRKLSHSRSLSVTRGGTSTFRSVETNV